MKIKKLQIGSAEKDVSLAVLHEGKWVVLSQLLEQFSTDGSEEYSKLMSASQDLILFLQRLPDSKEYLNCLLGRADLKICCQTENMKEIIPFRPLLYRDFMLCERHIINSGRGFTKFIMPNKYPIVRAYEAIFRRTFPAFKPKKAWYDNPVYYKGNTLSFIGDGEIVSYPQYATIKDYELELGMIITKELLNATEEEGLAAIGAFCVFNDFSARNVQLDEMKKTGFGPCKAKDFASSISNVVVTADEILPVLNTLKTRVFINEELVAEGQLNEFYHSLGKAVAYASKGERVYAGEFMASGTIPNCCGMENLHLLDLGDVIKLEIDNIGSLTNQVSTELI
ncbi:fumarylacetoacetate hydrolase family protein [Clostridium oryzae]|uniref:Ureidoglycolate lyase n=1 Tax=Clostridium oryzae TaxID=1450648 RepID=A0A1V4IX88_9CLOT|nr:fumarylacetoacetate hydrolase family protein [Clostridium oryzae]OPJ64027.1 ureidoglycolate lyase [Clostridium oryzae]